MNKLCIVDNPVYVILRKTNMYSNRKQGSGCLGPELVEGLAAKWHKGTVCDDRNTLCID